MERKFTIVILSNSIKKIISLIELNHLFFPINIEGQEQNEEGINYLGFPKDKELIEDLQMPNQQSES
jgi:hypothetical protein